jgi:hypothetical protein
MEYQPCIVVPLDETSIASSIHKLDESIWRDCIPADVDFEDFLAEGPISNNDDDSVLDLISEDSLVGGIAPMDFLCAQEEEERQPSSLSNLPYFPSECDDDVFLSHAPSIVSSESRDCDEEYLIAILRLRASMRHSEETRQHIRSQLFTRPSAPTNSFPNSMDFFAGSRSTLTTGLEHSRQMLMTYLQPMESL